MRNAGLDEIQAGIRLPGEISVTSDMQMTPPLCQKVKRNLKSQSEKAGLKLNIQKMKIMGFGPITSWQINGETMETVRDFIVLGSKITTDDDCSHEIKRRLLLGRKVMTNLDSIFKSRDITFQTKVHMVKAMIFPVVMYGCESWTINKELEKIFESPLDSKVIKPINPKGNQP